LNWDWFSYLYEVFTKSPENLFSFDAFRSAKREFRAGRVVRPRDGHGLFDLVAFPDGISRFVGLGAVVFVMTLSLTAFAVFLLLLAKLLVATTLGLDRSPLVAFLLFDATRSGSETGIASLVTLVVFN